jgi:thiamine kinase-like enzyme
LKALGQATTPAEQELEAILARVPPWAGRSLRYKPVLGGISNVNWRIWVDDAEPSYFLKVPGKGTEMFIDRAAAVDASRTAATLGVGPRVHEFLIAEGIEICDFVTDRRACTHADFQNETLCRAALDAYRRLHDAPKLSLTKTVFDMIDEHLEQVRSLGGWLPLDFERLHASYRDARAALEASGLDLTPCFNDPMAGNFMVNDAGDIMLIDYEYASNNDRCYDLGIWFGEMFFDEKKQLCLIEHYFGRVEEATVARVMLHKALADVKWSLWSFVQQRASTLPFDFFKYGAWKLMRLRASLDDPRWPLWLRQV